MEIDVILETEKRCKNCYWASSYKKEGRKYYECWAYKRKAPLMVQPESKCHCGKFHIKLNWLQHMWLRVAKMIMGKKQYVSY